MLTCPVPDKTTSSLSPCSQRPPGDAVKLDQMIDNDSDKTGNESGMGTAPSVFLTSENKETFIYQVLHFRAEEVTFWALLTQLAIAGEVG